MLRKVYDSPEFQEYLLKNALKAAWLTGTDYVKWLGETEALHRDLMQKGGLLK